jgi:DNA (cytosine-5)-methyltransferase 1
LVGSFQAHILFIRIASAEVEKLSVYFRISEAAEYLGVSPNTLRNWVNSGKVLAIRHPVNGYRLFRKENLDALLSQVTAAKNGVDEK